LRVLLFTLKPKDFKELLRGLPRLQEAASPRRQRQYEIEPRKTFGADEPSPLTNPDPSASHVPLREN